MSKSSETPVRPGGPLVERPVQGADGNWYHYGQMIPKKEAVDLDYAASFWKNQPEGMEQTMMSVIETTAQEGTFWQYVDQEKMTDKDKEKISAYRVLAKQMGYSLGGFTHQSGKPTGHAPIERTSQDS